MPMGAITQAQLLLVKSPLGDGALAGRLSNTLTLCRPRAAARAVGGAPGATLFLARAAVARRMVPLIIASHTLEMVS